LGSDTLSQTFIIDYGVLGVLDSITILSPNDTIRLRPDQKGRTVIENGKPSFYRFNDILVLPNTKGAVVPGGIKKDASGKVTKLSVSFWAPDEEGPRDDLFLEFAPSTVNGNFIFAPKIGAKVKLGLYTYTVVKEGGVEPLTVNITREEFDPMTAPGRDALPTVTTRRKGH